MKKQLSTLLCEAVVLLGVAAPSLFGQAPEQMERVMAAAATTESGQSYEPFRQIEDWVRLAVAQPEWRPQLEAELVKLLGPEAAIEARRFACKQLGIMGSASALPALAELLPSPATAEFACLALTTYPRGKADEVLRAALLSAHEGARIQIINTLGDRQDEKSVPLLVPMAWGPDQELAEAAIASLGKIGDAQARTALAALRERGARTLQPVVWEATLRCADQLATRGDKAAAVALYKQLVPMKQPASVRRGAFAALLRLEPSQAEHRILEVLRRPDVVLMPTAIAAIPALTTKGGSEPFIRELAALDPETQVLLLNSFAWRGDYPAVAAIIKEVDSTTPLVRRAALTSLGRAGDLSVVPVLVRALVELKSSEELRAAETALAELGGGSATDEAVTEAMSRSAGPLRVHLVSVVAKREGERANPLLLEEASNEDPAVAVAALRALSRSARERDVPALLAKLVEAHHPDVNAEAESAAVQTTMRIEDASRRSKLVRDALDRAQSVSGRTALLALLPSCGDTAALDALRAAAVSTEPPIHEAGVRALAEWPDMGAWDALAGAFRHSKVEQERGITLRGLVRLAGEANAHADAALVKRYAGLLEDAKSDSEKKLILGALGGAAVPEALDLVQPLLDRPEVKAEAEAAAKRISEALKQKGPKPEAEAPKEPSKQ
jgi:HEAT repeat protein